MNQPSRADRFILPEGERKLTFERDTKVENAGTFVIQREDHTIGNLLRMYVVVASANASANARRDARAWTTRVDGTRGWTDRIAARDRDP
jgi:hypothetical protein